MTQREQKYNKTMLDGRRKIDPVKYNEVKAFYKSVKSQRKTAKKFNISRRLVQFILDPEKLEQLKKHNKNIKHWRKYYDKDKRREYMRTYRAKKKKLGFIKNKTGRTRQAKKQ